MSEKLTRTYRRKASTFLHCVLDEGEEVDVTRLDGRTPLRFEAEGEPATDPFFVSRPAWEQLGEPELISLTLEPVT